MRYAGQAFELPVSGPARPDPDDLIARFERAHEERYGHRDPDGEVVLVDIRLALVAPGPRPAAGGARAGSPRRERAPGPLRRRVAGDAGAARRAGCRDRNGGPGDLRAARGDLRRPPGWSATVDPTGTIHAGTCRDSMPIWPPRTGTSTGDGGERGGSGDAAGDGGWAAGRLRGDGRGADPLRLLGQHQGAARLLDGALRRRRRAGDAGRAHPRPPRLDARRGRRACSTRSSGRARPGSSTTPIRGGTHLPDITLISPVFVAGELFGFAACRAHHADVGGPTPGGMPARSHTLEEEGVVIPPTPCRRGRAGAAGRADALAASATRRPARPGRRQPDRRATPRRARRAPRPRTHARRAWRRSSPMPSAAPAPPSTPSPTAPTRPPTCSRTTPATRRGTSCCGSRRRSTATGWLSTSPAPTRRSPATSTARSR